MKLQIPGIKKQPNKFGNDLLINRIGLYDETINILLNNYIDYGN